MVRRKAVPGKTQIMYGNRTTDNENMDGETHVMMTPTQARYKKTIHEKLRGNEATKTKTRRAMGEKTHRNTKPKRRQGPDANTRQENMKTICANEQEMLMCKMF